MIDKPIGLIPNKRKELNDKDKELLEEIHD